MVIYNVLRKSDFLSAIRSIYLQYFAVRRNKFGYIHSTAFYRQPILIKGVENMYLYEGTHILGNATILTTRAKVVFKKKSAAAEGLTIVTGTHLCPVGRFFMDITDEEKPSYMDKDVIIEEDAWLSCSVTILAGVTIGRGATVGAGAVVRKSVPPYAIVIGNPAKIVGFRFKPEDIIEHERALYPEDERLPLDLLRKNYDKYLINRIDEIKSITK
jgi:acetyltransferase-like isoleucine patch superfamily enzyme